MTEKIMHTDIHPARGAVFMSENPEAYGLVTDAYPVATGQWLVTAHGRSAPAGALPLTLSMEEGVGDLLRALSEGNTCNESVLLHTFGASDAGREHPVARYAAALTELTVLDILSQTSEDTSFDELSMRIGTEVPCALYELREVVSHSRFPAFENDPFAVSLGVCRLQHKGDGAYMLDIFTAGHYNAYLVDADGMRPIDTPSAPILSPEGVTSSEVSVADERALVGKRIHLHHPAPFSILLLSGGATALNAAEERNLHVSPGLIWHYRMRLEAYLLRLLAACTQESEFEERASRFFTGRLQGRDSASGALLFVPGNGSFGSFRSDCMARLRRVEDLIALLPDGYDPARVTELPSREETEQGYIRLLLTRDSELVRRVNLALRDLALAHIADMNKRDRPDKETGSLPFNGLSHEAVYEIFRLYDAENDEDRVLMSRNIRALREQFSAHWITLRPIMEALCSSDDVVSPETTRARDTAERSYELCLSLNTRLGDRLTQRRQKVDSLKALLTNGASVLSSEKEDWICGRAGDSPFVDWAESLASDIAAAVEALLADRDTDRCRSLLSAYMTERETLFMTDTTAPHGFFADDWHAITEGTLSDERWTLMQETARESLAHADDGQAAQTYVALIDALHQISTGTGVLCARIISRSADRRAAFDLAGRTEWQITAIRASAYEDETFGQDIHALLSDTQKKEYFAVLQRRQETLDLMTRRADAFAEYSVLYEGR